MTSGATTTSEIVNDFLTLPGIAGFAVIDGRRPAYFCNLDGTLMPADAAQLTRNLNQVFDSIPLEFTTIELHQSTYQTHLYRIDYSTLLLVLAHHTLEPRRYQIVMHRFLEALTQYRELLLDALQILRPSSPHHGSAATVPLTPYLVPTQPNPQWVESIPRETVIDSRRSEVAADFDAADFGAADLSAADFGVADLSAADLGVDAAPSLADIVVAFNTLTTLAVGYLGKIIVGNQIKTTRPLDALLSQLTIDPQAQLVVNPAVSATILTPEQHQLFQVWAYELIRAIARVIRNFQDDVEAQLSQGEKALLLGDRR